MTVEIISAASQLEKLRTGTHVWTAHPIVNGEMQSVEVRIENGRAKTWDLPRPLSDYLNPKGELMATPANLKEFVPKVTVDLEIALATNPTVYQPIYRSRDVPGSTQFVDISGLMGYTGVVFLERGEGEEIHFGTRERGQVTSVPIRQFAAGFTWTEELVKFDLSWRYDDMIEAIGRAHNSLLDRIHLRPIIEYTYPPENITNPTYDPAQNAWEQMWMGLYQALYQARTAKNKDTGVGRNPTVILTHSANTFILNEVLGGITRLGQPTLPSLGSFQIITYDDYVIYEGERGYTFVGMPLDHIFLIEPRQYFIELINQPLSIQTGDGDFSRYVASQLRANTWRAVVAAPEAAVQVLYMPPTPFP